MNWSERAGMETHPVFRYHIRDALPRVSGAYALCLQFGAGREIVVGHAPPRRLPAGIYVYAGSAYGPGGIRARVARHLSEKAATRWHVDALDAHENAFAVISIPDGNECRIVDAAAEIARSDMPIPGFGSSDCRKCRAHLVWLPERGAIEKLVRKIPDTELIWIADGTAGRDREP